MSAEVLWLLKCCEMLVMIIDINFYRIQIARHGPSDSAVWYTMG